MLRDCERKNKWSQDRKKRIDINLKIDFPFKIICLPCLQSEQQYRMLNLLPQAKLKQLALQKNIMRAENRCMWMDVIIVSGQHSVVSTFCFMQHSDRID